jgi:transcriptional regulator with XRE-family HTH domain
MPITRNEVAQETPRRMRRLGLQVGEDIRWLRSEAGVSISQLADAADVHRSHLARIEANGVQPSLMVLAAIGVALGADLSVRYFPGSGPRLHDRFQAAMLETVLRSVARRWVPELEVPITRPARGVIDLVLTDRSSPTVVAAEAQSELRRLEQQIRWGMEKADGLAQRLTQDHPAGGGYNVSRLLILRSTTTTRELARRYETTLAAAYPARTTDVVAALTTIGAPWPGAGIVWIRIDGPNVTLLPHPPRGVDLGR